MASTLRISAMRDGDYPWENDGGSVHDPEVDKRGGTASVAVIGSRWRIFRWFASPNRPNLGAASSSTVLRSGTCAWPMLTVGDWQKAWPLIRNIFTVLQYDAVLLWWLVMLVAIMRRMSMAEAHEQVLRRRS